MSTDFRILCFGDSNTWGVDLERDCRLPKDERWTGILAKLLGDSATVIEEGLGGRTTVRDDPYEPHRNGLTYLTPCLLTHDPLDLVILMLGTNDLKRRFATNAEDIARGISLLCEVIRATCIRKPVEILVISPAPFGDEVDPAEMWASGIEESRRLGSCLKSTADEHGAHFIDAGEYCQLDHGDGIHLNRNDHRRLGEAIHSIVVKLY